MAQILLSVDISNTAIEAICLENSHTINELLGLVICNFRPEELEGYENYRTSSPHCYSKDTGLFQVVVRCRKIN